MRIVGNDPTLSRQITATASGAISAAGKPLIVNADGTVKFAGQETVTTTIGSATTFDTNAITSTDITFDSTNNKVVVSFQSGRTGDYGVARVGTVDASNNTISFGTETVFESAAVWHTSIDFDSTNNKVLIVYRDGGNSYYGTAIVGTVSGTDISFGTATVFESAQTDYITTRFDPDNSKFLIVYKDTGNSNYGTAIVATISGTSVSFGSPTVYRSGQVDFNSCIYDTNANKFLVTYRNFGASGDGIVGTISGTSVSFGSATAFHSSGSTIYVNGTDQRYGMSFDSTANKILIAYIAYISSSIGYVVVGTISGTSVSFGSYVALGSAGEDVRNEVVYDSNTNKHLLMNSDDTPDPDHINIREVTISGTTPTLGSKVLVSDVREATNNALVFDSNAKKIVMAYAFGGNSNYGTANVVQTSGTVENLTTENFIGTSAHAAADGAKVLVNTQGAIDENQSGLTAGQTFFVDKNGALQLTTNIAQGVGTVAMFDDDGQFSSDVVFDPDSGKFIISYYDVGTSGKGTYVVATISGTDVTYGTPAVFADEATYYFSSAYDTNSDRVVVAYRGASNHGKAIVGTVSGTTVTWGTAVTFNAATTNYTACCFDSANNKIVIAYRDEGNSNYGTAIVGTVDPSDNSISFGSEAVFESAATLFIEAVFDTTNDRVIIAYDDAGNSNYGTAIVGQVSGTSISFGTAGVWRSDGNNNKGMSFDSNSGNAVIAHRGPNSPDNGRAIVAQVGGSNSISFGTGADFDSSASAHISIAFDSNVNKHLIVYKDANNSNKFTGIVATVSGTSISVGSSFLLAGDNVPSETSAAFDTTNNKFLAVFGDDTTGGGGSPDGKAVAVTLANDLSGSLSHNVVTAGTALSATKLLVKG